MELYIKWFERNSEQIIKNEALLKRVQTLLDALVWFYKKDDKETELVKKMEELIGIFGKPGEAPPGLGTPAPEPAPEKPKEGEMKNNTEAAKDAPKAAPRNKVTAENLEESLEKFAQEKKLGVKRFSISEYDTEYLHANLDKIKEVLKSIEPGALKDIDISFNADTTYASGYSFAGYSIIIGCTEDPKTMLENIKKMLDNCKLSQALEKSLYDDFGKGLGIKFKIRPDAAEDVDKNKDTIKQALMNAGTNEALKGVDILFNDKKTKISRLFSSKEISIKSDEVENDMEANLTKIRTEFVRAKKVIRSFEEFVQEKKLGITRFSISPIHAEGVETNQETIKRVLAKIGASDLQGITVLISDGETKKMDSSFIDIKYDEDEVAMEANIRRVLEEMKKK